MPKRTFISVETTQEIKEALKRKAGMEGKTVTDVISSMVNEYLNSPASEEQATNVTSLEQKDHEMQQTLEKHSKIISKYQQCLGELSA